jgi:hypothetical protein
MSAELAKNLKTYEGFVTKNADKYQDSKHSLTQNANMCFGNKLKNNGDPRWTAFLNPNVIVYQLDGNYLVIDTDDEESDNFACEIMAKYGIIDNVTPSLSNHLLGKKNKNHYWFQLPEDIRWTCKTHYTKIGQQKKYSSLDLLGSKNRIIFENMDCIYKLKNMPMMSQEILNDMKEYIPKALLEDKLNFQPVVKKDKIQKEANIELICIEKDTSLIVQDDECPQDVKEYINNTFTTEQSLENESFFFNGCGLLRKYGDEECGLGWKAVHYFAKMAGETIYNKQKVNMWLKGTKVETMSPTYGILKLQTNGECLIDLEEILSQAPTAGNSSVNTDDEEVIEVKEIIAFSEEEIAVEAFKELQSKYMYINKQFYGVNGNIWSNDSTQWESLLRNAIVGLKIKKRTEKQVKGGTEIVDIIWCDSYTHLLAVYKRVRDMIIANPRDDMYSLFHSTTLGKMCFEDGVYDFRKNSFNKWNSKTLKENPIYSCVKINRNFPAGKLDSKDSTKVIKVFYESMGKENGDKFLQYLARVCAGEIQDKYFSSLIFERDSSKGVINDWFETAFENYVGQADSNAFLAKDSFGDSEKENGWLIPFQYKRFMFVSEFAMDLKNTKKKICAKLVKQINSGGDTMKARLMRENGVHFKIQCSSIFMGNDEIPTTSVDMYEKCLQLSSCVQFKSKEQIKILLDDVKDIPQLYDSMEARLKIADPNLRADVKSKEWADALIRIIIYYYSEKPIVISSAKHEDEECESIGKKIMSKFKITGSVNDKITNEILRQFAFDNNTSLKKLKENIVAIDGRVKDFKSGSAKGMAGILEIISIASAIQEE